MSTIAAADPSSPFADFNTRWDRSMKLIDKLCVDYSIMLKKARHSAHLSRETEAFTAEVWADGQRIAHAENSGHGGSTMVSAAATRQGVLVRQGLDQLEGLLTMAMESEEGTYKANLGDLVDRLLFTQVLQPKQLKSIIGRTKVGWQDPADPDLYQTVRWPSMHKLWKTDAAKARATVLVAGIKSGWFKAGDTPVFVNDLV